MVNDQADDTYTGGSTKDDIDFLSQSSGTARAINLDVDELNAGYQRVSRWAHKRGETIYRKLGGRLAVGYAAAMFATYHMTDPDRSPPS